MLKGDLTATPLVPLLIDLAADAVTGCLVITAPDGEQAEVFLSGGLIYAINVSGLRPQLGAKLVSSGALAPEALADALEAQRKELQGWRLGELLVHLGYVDQPVVEAFVREQVQDALWDLVRWSEGGWRFRKNVKSREDVAPPTPVIDLLGVLRERGYEWESISAVVHGPNAVPVLSAADSADPETTLSNDAWSMLCKIDGQRTLADLASEGGYTLFEAGQVVVSLVHAGLVDIEEDIDVTGGEPYGASTLTAALTDTERPLDAAAEAEPETDPQQSPLSRLVNQAAQAVRPIAGEAFEVTASDVSIVPLQHRHELFATSIARVSSALSDVLGPDTDPPDPAELVDADLRARRARERAANRVVDPQWERQERLRAAAAAELVSAQELVESTRREQEAARAAAEREEAERREAERLATEVAERRAREAFQRLAEQAQAQLAAEEAAAREAQEKAARLAAEREAAEAEAWAEHETREAARIAAEEDARVAAEEQAARIAAEEQAARLAAEREAAEAEAWAEHETREAARIAAEEAAARQAAAAAEARARETAAATALLVELSSEEASTDETDAEPTDDANEEDPGPDEAEAASEPPAADRPREMADTAALLRELSSLGVDEDRRSTPPPAPGRRPPVRTVPSAAAKKKKRGLFGL